MPQTRKVKVFRYDPSIEAEPWYDSFDVEVEDEHATTILDLLIRIQKFNDPSLAFRYACRVYMCGSCGLVINGQEGLACQTVVADLPAGEITIRPLNHFPVIKDLAVDMEPFFQKYEQAMPYYEPLEPSDEPAIIRPDSKEREAIGSATECIACGCCVSACSMAHGHKDYLGPGAINRAFTLLADSRDGLSDERLAEVLSSCYHCRTEFNCTEVCPKDLSPTRAIKFIQRLAAQKALQRNLPRFAELEPAEVEPAPRPAQLPPPPGDGGPTRRRFMARATWGIGAAAAVVFGGVLAGAALIPAEKGRAKQWVPAGRLDMLRPGDVTTIVLEYPVKDGFYETNMITPVMVRRGAEKIEVFNSTCTHLGCQVRWDDTRGLFLCACHGGQFYPDGRVKAGPPPRPLDRHRAKVENGALLVEV
jgi:succinate dehydrogenase / fumarate reductase iron-sulfur subunit